VEGTHTKGTLESCYEKAVRPPAPLKLFFGYYLDYRVSAIMDQITSRLEIDRGNPGAETASTRRVTRAQGLDASNMQKILYHRGQTTGPGMGTGQIGRFPVAGSGTAELLADWSEIPPGGRPFSFLKDWVFNAMEVRSLEGLRLQSGIRYNQELCRATQGVQTEGKDGAAIYQWVGKWSM
jgi:hypothetical protein